jgi:hypothetical protein
MVRLEEIVPGGRIPEKPEENLIKTTLRTSLTAKPVMMSSPERPAQRRNGHGASSGR